MAIGSQLNPSGASCSPSPHSTRGSVAFGLPLPSPPLPSDCVILIGGISGGVVSVAFGCGIASVAFSISTVLLPPGVRSKGTHSPVWLSITEP